MLTKSRWGTTAALLACLGIYIAGLRVGRDSPQSVATDEGLPAIGEHLPAASGFTAPLKRFRVATGRPCVLLHYSTDGCKYCRLETPLWRHALSEAARAGCGVVSEAAYWGATQSEAGPGDHAAPLVFVPLSWAEAAPLRKTPTTLVLDGSWRVVWARVGALDPPALNSLEREMLALGALR